MSCAESAEADRLPARRFVVSWRNRVKPRVSAVGTLDTDASGYHFAYLPGAHSIEGFRPLVGFPDFDLKYDSSSLWPFFDVRVMDPKRPDFATYARWVGLDPTAPRLEILARTGEQKDDTISLIKAPAVASDGFTAASFLLRGTRFASVPSVRDDAVARLRDGDELSLAPDPTNEANPRALHVVNSEGVPVGWVPDLLIDYTRHVVGRGGDLALVQNNGDAPWHMRLLARVAGFVEPGTAYFTDERLRHAANMVVSAP